MKDQGKADVASATDTDNATATDTIETATSQHQKEPRPKKARAPRPKKAANDEDDTARKGRDKALEVEQLYKLMFPLARLEGRSTTLFIPLDNGQTLPCKLTGEKSKCEIARVWVFNKYQETYGHNPFVQTFNDACTKVHATLLFTSGAAANIGEEGDTDEGTSKKTNLDAERDNRVCAHADWKEGAIAMRATYARVPLPGRTDWAEEDTSKEAWQDMNRQELHGLWRLEWSKSTARLTDAYVQVVRVIRPAASAKKARYSSLVLKFTNKHGAEKTIEVTDDQFTSNELANKLSVFCTYPEDDKSRRYFLEAVKALANHEGAIVQEQTESLGYQKLEDGSLVWCTSSGVETVEGGFIDNENAPCLAPELISAGNGYQGKPVSPDVYSSHEDYWDLLFRRYAPHPDVEAMLLGLFCLSLLVMLPDGIADGRMGVKNGTVRVTPDVVGPSRHGKSRSLNGLLGLFGTGFYWHTGSLTTFTGGGGKGDTGAGRNQLMSKMRYHLWVDYDHTDSPGNDHFASHHRSRSDTIDNYVGDPTGGTTSSRNGRLQARDVPGGLCVRTSNYDHALTSIQEDKVMIEYRACTFVWPKEIKGDEAISTLIDNHKEQAYAMGQHLRRWYMKRVMSDKEGFRRDVEAMYDVARSLVSDGYEWAADWHKNHTAMMVLGTLIITEFLKETRPGYWLIDWIDKKTIPLIKNRVARSQFIKRLVDQKEEAKGIDTFVSTTLRKHFSTQMIYLRSQKDALLGEEDIAGLSFSMKEIGYRSVIRDHVETWEGGRQCIGYLVHKKQDIALSTDLLMELLKSEARVKGITLGSEQYILSTLIEKGIVVPDINNETGKINQYEQQVKIAGKKGRYLIVPVAALFTAEVLLDGKDEDEDEEGATTPAAPEGACTHCGSVLKLRSVFDDTIVWVCAKCKTPHGTHTSTATHDDQTDDQTDSHDNPFYEEELPEFEEAYN